MTRTAAFTLMLALAATACGPAEPTPDAGLRRRDGGTVLFDAGTLVTLDAGTGDAGFPEGVVFTLPADGEQDATLCAGDGGAGVLVVFSGPAVPASVRLTVTPPLMLGEKQMLYRDTAAFFPFAARPQRNLRYTATVSGAQADPLQAWAPYTFTFSGERDCDGAPPALLGFEPDAGPALDAGTLAVRFSEAMVEDSLAAQLLGDDGSVVPLTAPRVDADGTLGRFTLPPGGLRAGRAYVLEIEGVDLGGWPLPPSSLTFTTPAAPDTQAPRLRFHWPAEGTSDVPPNAMLVFAFDEPVTAASVEATLRLNGQPVPASAVTLSPDRRFVRVEPPLAGTPPVALPVSATVTAGFAAPGPEDDSGNPLGAMTFSFTTASAPTSLSFNWVSSSPVKDAVVSAREGCRRPLRVPLRLTAGFDAPLDPVELLQSLVVQELGTATPTPWPGRFEFDPSLQTVTFHPARPFNASKPYVLSSGLARSTTRVTSTGVLLSFTTRPAPRRLSVSFNPGTSGLDTGTPPSPVDEGDFNVGVPLAVGHAFPRPRKDHPTYSWGLLRVLKAPMNFPSACVVSGRVSFATLGTFGDPWGTLDGVLLEVADRGNSAPGGTTQGTTDTLADVDGPVRQTLPRVNAAGVITADITRLTRAWLDTFDAMMRLRSVKELAWDQPLPATGPLHGVVFGNAPGAARLDLVIEEQY
jgi:hypothetical protein